MSEQPNADQILTDVYSARLPTIYGDFRMTVYQDELGKEHVCMCLGEPSGSPLLVRIHSECLTGDVFGSIRCDCRDQLLFAFESIAAEGRGILIYLRQEGRGIGLVNKVQAYALQDEGFDTVDANLHLGLPIDDRNYSIAASILEDQGVKQVRLLTNNPQKVMGLEAGNIEVVERVPHETAPRPENQRYLKTKADKLGHLFGSSGASLNQ
jgi:3,4-dihydroxy 2-butanone 4-phosphate synthase/GTP cyclohydrolase II